MILVVTAHNNIEIPNKLPSQSLNQQWGGTGTTTINIIFSGLGQCTANAECSSPSGGLCQCNEGFYKDGDLCLRKLTEGQPCESTVQCIPNAMCSPGQ